MTFDQAKAVWLDDQNTLAQFVGFYANIDIDTKFPAVFSIAAVNAYRVFLNGTFVAHGPARCGHGYARIDRIPLQLTAGANHIAIEVAAFHMNSYEHTDQDGMLCAELSIGESVLLRSDQDFSAAILKHRIREVPRYSFQRPSCEVYDLNTQSNDWRVNGFQNTEPLVAVNSYQFIERNAPYPKYPAISAKPLSYWNCTFEHVTEYRQDRSLTSISDKLKGFPLDELVVNPQQIIEGCTSTRADNRSLDLAEHQAVIFDLKRNRSGFIQCELNCPKDAYILVSFDERLTDEGDVDSSRFGCLNVVSYQLKAGTYQLESFAPYTARFIKIHSYQGSCQISSCSMRAYENPRMFDQSYSGDDQSLNDIYTAAQHTISQNSVDIFMDCPSRERAGWLCDSFFMGRYERELCDKRGVEHDFLENFILPDSFKYLPDGMLPMCYPADFYNENFIPQWSLWYILQLAEYREAYPDCDLPERARPAMERLYKWFCQYENDDGFLESLPAWNFIEWSKANEFVQDVNYPTNMLYCQALEALSQLYGDEQYAKKSASLRQKIIDVAWDGEWFCDHAKRADDGSLSLQSDKTEVCQYYALFFGFRPDGWESLWNKLVEHFGSHYDATGPYQDIFPANAFIGYILRIDLMSQIGDNAEQCLKEIKGLYAGMAELTGTLWEHNNTGASCNHGFAGFIALLISKLSPQ